MNTTRSRRAVTALSLAIAGASLAAAHAQTGTCLTDPHGIFHYSEPKSGPSVVNACLDAEAANKRKAWQSDRFLGVPFAVPFWGGTPTSSDFNGFPMNLSLGWGPGPGDLPPIQDGAVSNTSPLVPRSAAHFAGAATYPTRALAEGVVDLITGSPLLTEIDFELPFGGATYRHARTYSEPASDFWHEREGPGGMFGSRSRSMRATDSSHTEGLAEEMYWDWHGQGWMMGENPIFLFDASYLGINTVPGQEDEVRTCYFMPDAHRSIPFNRVAESDPVRYEAPPHIDAMMVVNGGSFNWTTNAWTTLPTSIDVFLNRRTLRYHIELKTWTDSGIHHGQDVPIDCYGTDLHDVPEVGAEHPGLGIPYYGLVTYIADRYGNRIELNYVKPTQFSAQTTDECETCRQNSNQRGQLSTAQLKPAGEDEAAWTLVFVHREFYANDLWQTDAFTTVSGDRAGWDPLTFPRHRQTAVHSILVYEGEPELFETPSALTTNYTIAPMIFNDQVDDLLNNSTTVAADVLDSLDNLDVTGIFGLPDTWSIHARYMYADPWVRGQTSGTPSISGESIFLPFNYNPGELFTHCGVRYDVNALNHSPRLVKRTILTKKEDAESDVSKTVSLYRYKTPKTLGEQGYGLFDNHALGAVISDATVARLVDSLKTVRSYSSVESDQLDALWDTLQFRDSSQINENDLLLVQVDQMLPLAGPTSDGPDELFKLGFTFDLVFEHEAMDWFQGPLCGPEVQLPSADWDDVSGKLLSPLPNTAVGQMRSGVIGVRTYNIGERKGKATRIRRFVVLEGEHGGAAPSASDEVVRFPSPVRVDHAGDEYWPQIGRSALYAPYRLFLRTAELTDPAIWEEEDPFSLPIAADTSRWISYMTEEEIIDDESARSLPGESYEEPPIARRASRIVEMNAVGGTIRDMTYLDDGTVEAGMVLAGEQRVVDPNTQAVLAIRTAGWLKTPVADQDDTGLIKRFFYAGHVGTGGIPMAANGPVCKIAEGFQFGTGSGQPVFLTKAWVYNPHVKHLVDKEIRYLVPPTYTPGGAIPNANATLGDTEITYQYGYAHRLSPDGPVVTGSLSASPTEHEMLVHKFVTYPGSWLAGHDAAYSYSYVEKEYYDGFGRVISQYTQYVPASGSPTLPDNLGWFGRTYEYEDYSTPTSDDPGSPFFGATPESKPGVLRRIVAQFAPTGQEWVESYPDYEITSIPTWPPSFTPSSSVRPRTIIKPDGTAICELRKPNPSDLKEVTVKTYTGYVTRNGSPAEVIYPKEIPVQVRKERSGKVIEEQARVLAADITGVIRPTGSESTTELWRKTPVYDPEGRLIELKLEAAAAEAAKAKVGYDVFGKVVRLESGSGSIVRTMLDAVGRVTHVFKGTTDLHEVWGTFIDIDEPPCTALYPDDDMCLVESHRYGTGTNDATLPVAARRYREKPLNQYRLEGCGSGVPANNEDTIGIAELTKYDARMRPVKKILQRPPSATNVRTTVTWYDHQDRVRFVGVYSGSPSLGSVDPEAMMPATSDSGVPAESSILATNPLTLHESKYDPQGRVIEERDYDVAVSAGTAYTRSRTSFDAKGRAVYQEGPGGRANVSVYDHRDLLLSTTTVAVDYTNPNNRTEIEKTINEYDPRGRLWEVKRLERIHDATGDVLTITGTPNAIQTRTFYWHDPRGLQVASAELGTENSSDEFANSSSLIEREDFPSVPCTKDTSGRITGLARNLDSPAVLPALALVRVTEFDAMERVIGEVAPNGSVTRKEYDGLGRILQVTENALATNADERRITAYHYDEFGRLDKIAALKTINTIDWEDLPDDGSVQVTELTYGAPVVEANGDPISTDYIDPDKIATVHFPEPDTGLPGGHCVLDFEYLLTGEIASRTDARDIALKYAYDERSNLVEVLVDYTNCEVPVEGWATDLTERIAFGYDQLDRIEGTENHLGDLAGSSSGDKISANGYVYDTRGNLLKELQAHGDDVAVTTPFVEYGYAFCSAGEASTGSNSPNTDRLASIRYPDRSYATSGNDGRLFTLSYGTANSADDRLSRLTRIVDSTLTKPVAAMAYAGLARRVDLKYGENSSSTAQAMRLSARGGSGPGYDNLDSWGRTKTLKYTSSYSGNTTIYQADIGYTAGGDVAWQRVNQLASSPVTSGTNDRSWLFSYDMLNRLIETERGQLDLSTSTPFIVSTSGVHKPRKTTWVLDRLSNWSGDSVDPGRTLTAPPLNNPTGTLATTTTTHATDGFNALHEITTQVGSGTPTAKQVYRDEAGNLRFDGNYLYQYDAFGRLVLITQAGAVSINSSGALVGTPGYWLKHFTYDSFGRLIRTQVPWPWLDVEALAVTTRRFFYDGGRRIQERSTVPLPVDEEGKALSIPKEHEFEEEYSIEYPSYVTREYVWDPDQTDRLLAQIEPNAGYCFVATDESWTPVASVEGGLTTSSGTSGRVLTQFAFDPLGNLLNREDVYSAGAGSHRLDVGHQGLFFEPREDETLEIGDADRLAPSVSGLYFNRARWYDAETGRFTISDPNHTGLALGASTTYHGSGMPTSRPVLDTLRTYRDGANLWTRGGGNSLLKDPTGLEVSVAAQMGQVALRAGIVGGISVPMLTLLQAHEGEVTGRQLLTEAAIGFTGSFLLRGFGAAISKYVNGHISFGGGVSARMLADDVVVASLDESGASATLARFTAKVSQADRGCLGGFVRSDGSVDFVPFNSIVPGHRDAVRAGLIPEDAIGGFSMAVHEGRIMNYTFASTLNKGDAGGILATELQTQIRDALASVFGPAP